MFIAMNRFKIHKGHEEAFEDVWKNRTSRLEDVPGFQDFKLLRGTYDDASETTLFASHTIWESQDAFVNWTKSEHFRQAHEGAGDRKAMYDGHPIFEGFHMVEGA